MGHSFKCDLAKRGTTISEATSIGTPIGRRRGGRSCLGSIFFVKGLAKLRKRLAWLGTRLSSRTRLSTRFVRRFVSKAPGCIVLFVVVVVVVSIIATVIAGISLA